MNQDEKPPKPIYVYVLTDPRYPDDVRYVGVTVNPQRRMREHILEAKNGKRSHRANWIRSLLNDELLPIMAEIDETNNEEWQQCEVAWIAYYREMGCDLVNSTDGGEGVRGHIKSEEHRRKQSEAMSGEKNSLYGKHHSEESKRKISLALSGENHPQYGLRGVNSPHYGKRQSVETRRKKSELSPTKKPVLQYDKFGHFIRQWDGVRIAERETGICLQNIIQCCKKNGYKSAGGFVWRYADDPLLGEYPTQLKLDLE